MKTTICLLLALLTCGGLFAQNIALPAPQKTGGMPLMEALAKRSTVKNLDSKELTDQQLSNLLWAAFGVNRANGRRTAPSARNAQEVDIYVLLKQGTFVYDAKQHQLTRVSAEDIRSLGGPPSVQNAPVTLILVGDLAKAAGNSPEDKKNTANIDTGYVSQNVYLFCASEGLATGARSSIVLSAATLGPKLQLRADQTIILAQSVGYPKS